MKMIFADVCRESSMMDKKTEVEKRWVELGIASRRVGLSHNQCPISESGDFEDCWREGWIKEGLKNQTKRKS